MLTSGTTGEVSKWKVIVVLPFDKLAKSAGVSLTVKSLAWTVAGSTGSLTLIMKSVGGINYKTTRRASHRARRGGLLRLGHQRSALMAMINVAARVIFIFHYHFFVAV